MKGSTALAILRNLPEPRLDGFLDLLRTEPSGDDMVAICRFMLDTGITSEAEICNQFQYTKGKYQPKLAAIGRRLITYSTQDRESLAPWRTLELAYYLVKLGLYDATTDVVRSGLRVAEQTEELDLMSRFYRVFDMFPEDLVPEDIDAGPLHRSRMNLHTYEMVFHRLREVAQSMDPITSRQAANEALSTPELAGPERALTKRALYLYWRIRFLAHSVLRQREQAIACQEVTIPLLREHPWLGLLGEYDLVRQVKLLAEQLRAAGQVDRYRQVRSELDAMELVTPLARHERLFIRFPVDIIEAMCIVGDTEVTIRQCRAFLELLKAPQARLMPAFITTNLYCCLHGAISTGNQALWQEVAAQLPRFAKTDFSFLYYPMYRFLEVIHSIDIGDHEEAYRLSKNLRRSDAVKLVQGMDTALGYLMPPLYAVMHKPSLSVDQLLADGWDAARAALVGSALVERFDLTVWYEARIGGCTMTEIVRRRTTPSTS